LVELPLADFIDRGDAFIANRASELAIRSAFER